MHNLDYEKQSLGMQAAEPTLESVINGIRESQSRISSATSQITEQLGRLGFVQLAPATPTTGGAMVNPAPGRERTAMERLIELADQLQVAATDCEWNHKHLQKQF